MVRALAIAALLASGCSVIVTRNAPKQPISEPTCTDSRVPAVIDALIAGVFTFFTVELSGGSPDMQAHVGGLNELTGVIAVLFAGSAVVGFVQASNCDHSKEAWAARPQPKPPEPARPPAPPLVEAIEAKDPVAARLTREAHEAAAADECGPTLANARRVQTLDAEYYEKVFLVDELIARCR